MFVERNIEAGEMTYGERIELGKLLASEKPEVEKFEGMIEMLHGFKPGVKEYKKYVKYVNRIIDALNRWAERERRELSVPPLPEYTQAGYDKYIESVGEMATLVSLGAKFGKNPEEILEWRYTTVFMILKCEAEQENFNRRLQKVYSQKHGK